MTQAAKVQEPSMEEILASIRRIIADDDARAKETVTPKPVPAAPVAPPSLVAVAPIAPAEPKVEAKSEPERKPEPEPEPDSVDILDLTESMEVQNMGEAFPKLDADNDVAFAAAATAPKVVAPPPTVVEARRQFSRETEADRSLLSSSTTAAVDSAFNSLAQTVLVQNAQTLDGLVREMLRPMLKVWLDDNLPSMVERLVRAEIERVSRAR